MDGGRERGGRWRDALKSRDFRTMCAAYVVDGLGSWAYLTVIIVHVFERTGSTTWIAILTASGWIPRMLLSPYAGVLADRYERTRVMQLSAFGSCLGMAGLAVAIATEAPIGVIVACCIVNAVLITPYGPAAAALTPEMVPERDLTAANGFHQALENLNVVIGPAVGGVLLAFDPAIAVAVNSGSFLISMVLISTLKVRSRGDAHEEGESTWKAFTDGLSALRAERVATILVLFCALDSAVYGASTVLYVPISDQLGTGNNGFGYLLAGMALGGVISAGIADKLSGSRRLAPIIVGGIALQTIPFGLTAFVEEPAIGFALQVISGSGMVLVDVLAITALQRDMPRGVLGRVMSLLDIAVLLAIIVASFGFSTLLRSTDLDATLYVLGLGFPLVAMLCIGPLLRADRNAAEKLRFLEPRISLLQVLDLFEAAPRRALEGLAESVEVREVPAGSFVVREGEPADALWVIVDGEVSVSVGGGFVRTMGPRSYFGEIGLLRGIPRTATVRTNEATTLWRISGEDFLDAVHTNAASASLNTVMSSRLARTHPRLAMEPAAEVPAS